MSDGRIITGNKLVAQLISSSSSASVSPTSLPTSPKLPVPPAIDKTPNTPFFAAQKATPELIQPPSRTKAATVAVPKFIPPAKTTALQIKPNSPKQDSSIQRSVNEDPQDSVTNAFSSFFGTLEVTSTSTTTGQGTKATSPTGTTINKIDQSRQAAAESRKEAADAKQRAPGQKARLTSITPPLFQAASVTPQVSPEPAKRSPTLSIFGSSLGSNPGNSQKSTPKSPTFSLFELTPSNAEGSLVKSASAQVPSKTVKKQASKGATTKSQTFNIAGVGGGETPKKLSREKSKEKVTAKKAVLKKESAMKGTVGSSTFSLFRGPSKSKSAPVKKESSKTFASQSPTFSLFSLQGANPSTTKEASSGPKSTSTKSPTFSLFKGVVKTKQEASKSNSKKARFAVSTSKSKVSLSSDSVFGGFFGGGRSNSSKTKTKKKSFGFENRGLPLTPKSSTIVCVPTLKQWKENPDNSIEARIYGSSSFSDGEIITTSPIEKTYKVAKGNIVQTSSGSKYLLS